MGALTMMKIRVNVPTLEEDAVKKTYAYLGGRKLQ